MILMPYKGNRGMDYTEGPLTPALSPSEGEREKHRQIVVQFTLRTTQ